MPSYAGLGLLQGFRQERRYNQQQDIAEQDRERENARQDQMMGLRQAANAREQQAFEARQAGLGLQRKEHAADRAYLQKKRALGLKTVQMQQQQAALKQKGTQGYQFLTALEQTGSIPAAQALYERTYGHPFPSAPAGYDPQTGLVTLPNSTEMAQVDHAGAQLPLSALKANAARLAGIDIGEENGRPGYLSNISPTTWNNHAADLIQRLYATGQNPDGSYIFDANAQRKALKKTSLVQALGRQYGYRVPPGVIADAVTSVPAVLTPAEAQQQAAEAAAAVPDPWMGAPDYGRGASGRPLTREQFVQQHTQTLLQQSQAAHDQALRQVTANLARQYGGTTGAVRPRGEARGGLSKVAPKPKGKPKKYASAEAVRSAFQAGDLSRAKAIQILQQQFGMSS